MTVFTVAVARLLENTGPLSAAVTDVAELLVVQMPLVVPAGGAALPALCLLILWLSLNVCTDNEPAFSW